jgi:hypothetical protein
MSKKPEGVDEYQFFVDELKEGVSRLERLKIEEMLYG